MRRKALVAVLLVVVGVGLVLSGLLGGTADEPAADAVPEDSLIAVEGDYDLWPYTSRSRSVGGRTLAINVVFHDDADAVREALTAQPETDWEETDELETDADPGLVADAVTETDWEDAHGSVRYSYFEGSDGGEWVDETFEFHDGEYLGSRDHVRAYESPDEAYTAIQVHEEYYDWFRLRHTVTDISEPAIRLEDDFIESGTAATVTREHRGIDGGWSDGWLTVIELTILIPVVGTLLRRRTREVTVETAERFRTEASRHADAALLGAALAAVFLGVRAAGIGLELAYPELPPKAIAAPLYLAIAVGLPALVIAAARGCEPTAAFLGVVVGLGGGFVLDFAGLGVAVPPDLIVHRAVILAALGLVAVGRASHDRGVLVAGVLAWTFGLALPLTDVL